MWFYSFNFYSIEIRTSLWIEKKVTIIPTEKSKAKEKEKTEKKEILIKEIKEKGKNIDYLINEIHFNKLVSKNIKKLMDIIKKY